MRSNIAFFTHAEYVSGKIRGEQIAERLDVTCNVSLDVNKPPKHVVFVKTLPYELDTLLQHGVTVWADVVDTDNSLVEIAQRPLVNVIAIGDTAEQYLRARLGNKVVKIPQQHCNFENHQNIRWPPKVVGFVGYQECFDLPFSTTKAELAHVGLEFKHLDMDEKTTRDDVVAFYQSIDIQVTFRGPRLVQGMPPEMKNPLKVINAASFGIPTVGFQEFSYREFPVHYKVKDLGGLVYQCKRLIEENQFFRTALLEKAERYHVDTIIERYKEVLS